MSLNIYAPSTPTQTSVSSARTFANATPVVLFTVVGVIKVLSLVGRISTVVGAGATTIKVNGDPTVGADTDFTAQTAITNRAAGGMLGMTGVPTDQLQLGVAEGFAPMETNEFAVMAGTIVTTAVGGTTGAIIWYLTWQPLSADASVTAS